MYKYLIAILAIIKLMHFSYAQDNSVYMGNPKVLNESKFANAYDLEIYGKYIIPKDSRMYFRDRKINFNQAMILVTEMQEDLTRNVQIADGVFTFYKDDQFVKKHLGAYKQLDPEQILSGKNPTIIDFKKDYLLDLVLDSNDHSSLKESDKKVFELILRSCFTNHFKNIDKYKNQKNILLEYAKLKGNQETIFNINCPMDRILELKVKIINRNPWCEE